MIKMLKDNVLVTDIQDMELKAGEIFLPDSMMSYGDEKDTSQRRYSAKIGTIVDFGPQAYYIEKGQKCFLAPMKGKEFTQDGKEYMIYKYEEIFGVVD